jgi:hypothetical protein
MVAVVSLGLALVLIVAVVGQLGGDQRASRSPRC